MRLSEAMDLFYISMEGIVSDSTIKFYKNRLPSLIHSMGDVDISKVTLDDLRLWRSKLSKREIKYEKHKYHPQVKGKLSPYYIRQHVKCVRRFFNWCFEDGKILDNPAHRLKLPPKPDQPRKGISKSDLTKMIMSSSEVRDQAIILFLADTGCRVGGLTHLKIDHIDLDNNRAIIFEKGKGGNAKKRIVFFGERTAHALSRYLVQRPSNSVIHPDAIPFIFLGLRKSGSFYERLTENGVYQALKRIAQKCGVKGYNPHNFRHGAIRGWLNNGMPLSLASQLAGHSSVSVTSDIYGTANENELSEAHSEYTWLN